MTDRPAWLRRVRAIVTGDTTDGGSYRLTVDDGQPDDRDRAVAAALIAQARHHDTEVARWAAISDTLNDIRPATPGGTVTPPNLYPGDNTPMDDGPRPPRAATLADSPGPADPLNPTDPEQFVPVTEELLDNLLPNYPAPPRNDRPVNDLLGLDTPDPLADSGIHHVPDPAPATVRTPCTHCEGTGYLMRTVSELLRESIALIPADGGQGVIREFYRRLLTAAPALASLFPPDLITAATDDLTSPGHMQRDRLLQALAALADLYGTTDADRQRLDTALRAYGRSHAAFARPDGTVRGATIEEYVAVKAALMNTLHSAAGAAWLPQYDAAWSEAYDYATVIMLHEQITSGMSAARYPRTAL
jgi:hemoglobin-like flavoprotein